MDVRQAVILAGGKGTRLLPLTQDVPKPLILVAGKPFLFWQLSYLKEQGIDRVLLLTSHLHEKIEAYFAKNPVAGIEIRYSVEPRPLGTGGAIRHAVAQLDQSFWLLNGDSFLDLDLSSMLVEWSRRSWDACMVTTPKKLVDAPGNVRVLGSLVRAYKKSATELDGFEQVDAGVYLLRRSVIETATEASFDMGHYWPPLIEREKLGAFPASAKYFDIGTPERLKAFETYLRASHPTLAIP